MQELSHEEWLARTDQKLCLATSMRSPEFANRILGQFCLGRKFGEPYFPGDTSDVEAFGALLGFGATNALELLLAAQMNGVHEASLSFLLAAGQPGIGEKQRDVELRRATSLMRVFVDQVKAMTQLKIRGWSQEEPEDLRKPTCPQKDKFSRTVETPVDPQDQEPPQGGPFPV